MITLALLACASPPGIPVLDGSLPRTGPIDLIAMVIVGRVVEEDGRGEFEVPQLLALWPTDAPAFPWALPGHREACELMGSSPTFSGGRRPELGLGTNTPGLSWMQDGVWFSLWNNKHAEIGDALRVDGLPTGLEVPPPVDPEDLAHSFDRLYDEGLLELHWRPRIDLEGNTAVVLELDTPSGFIICQLHDDGHAIVDVGIPDDDLFITIARRQSAYTATNYGRTLLDVRQDSWYWARAE